MKELSSFLSRIFDLPETGTDMTSVTWAEANRFQSYTILILMGVPVMVVLGLFHFYHNHLILGSLLMLSAPGLFGGWFALRNSSRSNTIYRINGLLVAFLFCYLLIIGGEEGSKSLWIFTFPLVSHFLFGKMEGLVWNVIFYLSMICLLYVLPVPFQIYPYSAEFIHRFLAIYLIVSIFSYWFESSVNRYRRKLLRENSKLRTALDEVKTLRGLLPICSYCHNIRNDEGFWNTLDAYLSLHTEVKFSHGICPDCLKTHFPRVIKAREEKKMAENEAMCNQGARE